MTKNTINKRALELIFHSHSHISHRLVVHNFWRGSAAATTPTRILAIGYGWNFYLVMVWNFCLGYGLDSLLGMLALEKDALPWLAIVLLPELFYMSRLRCSWVDFVPMVG
jgi:hypothetical protein